MGIDSRLERFVRSKARAAGRQYGEARRAYEDARRASTRPDYVAALPRDDDGRVRIACRRYAERRAVSLDDRYRPACFDPDHLDCQGCLEDIRDGRIETW